MPDDYRVVISAQASSDLHAVFNHIAKDSVQNAAGLVERLLRSMDDLGTFPHRYPVVSARRKPPGESRVMPVRPYLVYYRVIESDHVVLISTVIHGARRQPRR